ncbi:MAG: PQQ-dependent sugar dehydrogenase [Candidatus Geothermarchaeales archaeon]
MRDSHGGHGISRGNVAVVALAMVVVVGLLLAFLLLPGQEKPPPRDVSVEVVAEGLEIPWSLAFSPDGRLFVTERPGRVRVAESGVLVEQPLLIVDVAAEGEGGLLGMALHPDFSENGYVYLYHTYRDGENLWNRVQRYREDGSGLIRDAVILESIPGSSVHNGGRLKFGPDDKLYVTTGDASQPDLAQDLNSLAGKILRLNPDGSIPDDNPFPGSPVYSYGHRNPQGLDWQQGTGLLFEAEHGPIGHDEVNMIEPGKNYGWPLAVGQTGDPRFAEPLFETGAGTLAPSGISFYHGDLLPWRGVLFVASLRASRLQMLFLSGDGSPAVDSNEALFQGVYGRLRDVVQGPDGFLYFSTSNRDGRGTSTPGDDRILRITHASELEYGISPIQPGRMSPVSTIPQPTNVPGSYSELLMAAEAHSWRRTSRATP